MTNEQLDKLNKWAAEKISGLEIVHHGKGLCVMVPNHPEIVIWTLKDPRCREIVREKLMISTTNVGSCGLWIWAIPKNALVSKELFDSIAEAELACILAIMESEGK